MLVVCVDVSVVLGSVCLLMFRDPMDDIVVCVLRLAYWMLVCTLGCCFVVIGWWCWLVLRVVYCLVL